MKALSMGDRLGSPLGVAGFEYLRLSHFFAMVGLSGKKNILLIDVFAIYVGRGWIRNNSILVYKALTITIQ